MLDSPLMSPCEPSLKKSSDPVDKLKVFDSSCMEVAHITDIPISRPSVASYFAPMFNISLKKSFNAVSRGISDNASPYSAKPFGSFILDCNNHDCLSFRSSPDRTVFPCASNTGLINFNQPGKTFPVLKHHGSPKLVQDAPGRLVTSKTENPLKSFCATSVLLSDHPPCCSEPNLKRNTRILIYGSSLDRCLTLTGRAHQKPASHLPMLLLAALRTREALRPFHGYKILGTGRFRAKFLLKFQYCFGVGIHSATLPVVATLVKGIAQ